MAGQTMMDSFKISTRTHAVLDYLTAAAMFALPRLLGGSESLCRAASAMAMGKLGYTVFTRHEGGIIKVLPMEAHLALDAVGGAGLCALPFLSAETDWRGRCREDQTAASAAVVGLGLFDIIAAPLTQVSPEERAPTAGEELFETVRRRAPSMLGQGHRQRPPYGQREGMRGRRQPVMMGPGAFGRTGYGGGPFGARPSGGRGMTPMHPSEPARQFGGPPMGPMRQPQGIRRGRMGEPVMEPPMAPPFGPSGPMGYGRDIGPSFGPW